MEDKTIKKDAKSVVDMLFDGKLFKSAVTRDDMVAIEELVYYMMKTRVNSIIKAKELQARINKLK